MFLMRDYAKRIRRIVSFVVLDSLEDDQLDLMLGDLADKALWAARPEISP
jgi:hypothetical protein